MATIGLQAAGTYFGGPTGGAIGATIGSFVDQKIFGKDRRLPDQVGAKLSDLKVQFSSYGAEIPICYGNSRVAGNVMWARDLKEVEVRQNTSSGGKGGGPRTTQGNLTYQYFATLAIAICEGEIDSIERVWADTKIISAEELSQASGKYSFYSGSETQSPDPIIESYEGAGNVPAYRGLAYVVIEDFPLEKYGNRIPNFTFEVKRTMKPDDAVQDKVKDIILIPGSGEFVYSTQKVSTYDTYYNGFDFVPASQERAVNSHNFEGKANVVLALDKMQQTFPNLEYVAVVVNWFITSKNVGSAQIVPKNEFDISEGNTTVAWNVAGLDRASAEQVRQFSDGTKTYGGTPSDNSIIELLQELNNRGLKVLFMPMPLVDTTDEMPGEENKPWRGRLVPASAADVTTFFTRAWGFNNFVNHYANLQIGDVYLKDLVDAFLIGTEMEGLTTYDSGSNTYPAVSRLATLAGVVKTAMGSGVKISYAANWSEYHSINGFYHLDELWSNSNIDFVGIDAYFPLTPDLPQSQITEDKIIEYWEKGEGWDYFYTDPEARTGQTDYPNDEFAWKNVEYWWNNAHDNSGTPTGWTAKMKPIWFTEFGFASVDGTANQPNVFVDPSSSENFFPRASKERIDFLAQREAINASLNYFNAKNQESGNSDLLPRTFLWTYDARPYPYFPDLKNVWADSNNWKYGHWVQGKIEGSIVSKIVEDLLLKVGLTTSDIETSTLTDILDGMVVDSRQPVRDVISQLATSFFFDSVETGGKIKFIKRGSESEITVTEDKIIPTTNENTREIYTRTIRPDLELPKQIDFSYISRIQGYEAATQTALRQTSGAIDKISLNMPIVLSDTQAKLITESSLYTAWMNRAAFKFKLMPEFLYLDPTDRIQITHEGISDDLRIVNSNVSNLVEIEAVSEDVSTYDFYFEPAEGEGKESENKDTPETKLHLLDLPLFPTESEENGVLRIAGAGIGENWQGMALYRSNDGGEDGGNNFALIEQLNSEASFGLAINALTEKDPENFDFASALEIVLTQGTLSSINELALLNGGNTALLGNEIIQFQNAELLSTNRYKLTKLLRGRLGTESEITNHTEFERFILLDSNILSSEISLSLMGLERHYKPVSIGKTVTATTEQAFTYNGLKYKPYSVADVKGERDSSQNLSLTWKRRTRKNGGLRDFTDVPLSEAFEKYEIDILDGADVVRTITATQQTVSYSAAEQIIDFGSEQSNINLNIFQISELYGRGYKAVASV